MGEVGYKTLAIDIETFSDVDLIKCGVYAYADSPAFEILLFAYSFDDEETKIIDLAQGEQLTEEIKNALSDVGIIKTAFNANFERTCLSKYMGVRLSPESWVCTAVQSAMLALPLSLEGVGAVLGLSEQKLKEGKDLIRYFCVPCKPTKTNGGRSRTFHAMHRKNGNSSRRTASVTWMWKKVSGRNCISFRYRNLRWHFTVWIRKLMTGEF